MILSGSAMSCFLAIDNNQSQINILIKSFYIVDNYSQIRFDLCSSLTDFVRETPLSCSPSKEAECIEQRPDAKAYFAPFLFLARSKRKPCVLFLSNLSPKRLIIPVSSSNDCDLSLVIIFGGVISSCGISTGFMLSNRSCIEVVVPGFEHVSTGANALKAPCVPREFFRI